MTGGLVVHGLTVTYQRRPVLRGVGLEAPSGTVTGIIGPNGAGKSTLLKAVLGLVPRDAGTVTVDGGPVHAARRRIAYLPQRAVVDWDYPAQVGEVVAMGRYPHLGPLRRPSARDRRVVTEALERTGLRDLAARPIGELSGGQQQRVFFARALAQEASLYLLDEPFAAVDALTAAFLSGLLRDLATAGVGVVVVNHDLSAVQELCDRLVLLDVTVIAAGTPGEVLTPAALARAYGGAPGPLAEAARQAAPATEVAP